MSSKTKTIVARYFRFLKDVFSDLDEYDQVRFWQTVGNEDPRFKEFNTVPPTWQEKLTAFDGTYNYNYMNSFNSF